MKIDILIALHIRVYIRGYLRLCYIMAKLGGYFKLGLDNEPARLGSVQLVILTSLLDSAR